GLIRRALHPGEIFQFVAPSAAVAAFLIHDEWTHRSEPSSSRFARLMRHVLPFAAGIAVPVAVFLIPYFRSSATGAFVNGVFLLPARRFSFATIPAPGLASLWALLPVAAWAIVANRIPTRFQRNFALGVAVLLAALLVASGRGAAYHGIWDAARNSLPIL